MNLPKFAVRRPVTVAMLFAGLFILGATSLPRIPLDMLPEMEPPALSVLTPYPGASASDVESEVTKDIEDVLITISGLDKLTSLSKDGLSIVTCVFEWGTDLDAATNDVRDKLDLVRGELPDDAEEPIIFKFGSSMMPVVVLGVMAKESYPQLYYLADKKISDELKRVPGVGTVYVEGGQERQINVYLDPDKLHLYGISPEEIRQKISAENLNLPAGKLKLGRYEYQLRVPARFSDPSQIGDIILRRDKGRVLYLRDVATIEDSYKETFEKAWINGQEGIALSVMKQSGANTVFVANAVKKKLEQIKKGLPSDVDIKVILDTSEPILRMLRNLTSAVIVGAILVIGVTLLFLRDFKTSFIISTTIPFCIIISFSLMYLAGFTINLGSLMSLAIAVGMVVDSAIVVLENIVHHRDEGMPIKEAAVFGAEEVALAISASIFTTVVVFAPLMFATGITGVMFKQLAAVVTFTLLASLFTALTLTPSLSSKLLAKRAEARGALRQVYEAGERFLERVNEIYSRVIAAALHHPRRVFMLAGCAVVLGGVFSKFVGSEFMPSPDVGQLSIVLELPQNTRVEYTEKIAEKVSRLYEQEVPEKKVDYVAVGQSEEGYEAALGFRVGANVVRSGAKLVDKKYRHRSAKEIADALRKKMLQIPGIQRMTVQATSPLRQIFVGGGKPIVIEIMGHDLDKITAVAEEIKDILNSIEGTVDVTISQPPPRTELWVEVDKERATSLGISTAEIARTLRAYYYGVDAEPFWDASEEYDIHLQLPEEIRDDPERLLWLPLKTIAGKVITLGNVAHIEERPGPVEIKHKERQRVVYVEADTFGRSMGEVMREFRERIRTLELPQGVDIKYGGEVEEQRKSFRTLLILLMLGIVFVYMIMASQFESFVHPFVIMFSTPFALVGAVFFLAITRITLNLMSFIGLIMLMGIVVNNGIVLVDYINILRRRDGVALYEAVVAGARRRLRPVLMTALTTMFGMLPLALQRAEGAEVWRPLGVAVIGGLFVSTFVTLVLIPTIYYVLERRREGA